MLSDFIAVSSHCLSWVGAFFTHLVDRYVDLIQIERTLGRLGLCYTFSHDVMNFSFEMLPFYLAYMRTYDVCTDIVSEGLIWRP